MSQFQPPGWAGPVSAPVHSIASTGGHDHAAPTAQPLSDDMFDCDFNPVLPPMGRLWARPLRRIGRTIAQAAP